MSLTRTHDVFTQDDPQTWSKNSCWNYFLSVLSNRVMISGKRHCCWVFPNFQILPNFFGTLCKPSAISSSSIIFERQQTSPWLISLLHPQCLKTRDVQDDVHSSFAQLLGELNKANAPYALSVANRLYGEQSYQFVEVCVYFSMYLQE